MYCDRCGTQNRDGASFCKVCGQPLRPAPTPSPPAPLPVPGDAAWETPPPRDVPPVAPQPPAAPAGLASPQSKKMTGSGLITFGALLVLFGFMTTWASCGAMEFSGFDLAKGATSSSSYGGEQSATVSFLWLVPLAGLGLLILGALNVAHGLGWVSSSPLPESTTGRLSWAATLGGLAMTGLFLIRVLQANSEAGFQVIKLGEGYWLSVFGFLLVAAGIALASAANQPRAGP